MIKEQDEAIQELQGKLRESADECESLRTAHENDSTLIMKLSKKLETLLMENEDLREVLRAHVEAAIKSRDKQVEKRKELEDELNCKGDEIKARDKQIEALRAEKAKAEDAFVVWSLPFLVVWGFVMVLDMVLGKLLLTSCFLMGLAFMWMMR